MRKCLKKKKKERKHCWLLVGVMPYRLYFGRRDPPTLIKTGPSLFQSRQKERTSDPRRRAPTRVFWAPWRRRGLIRRARTHRHTTPSAATWKPPSRLIVLSEGRAWSPGQSQPEHRVPMMSYLWILLLGSLLTASTSWAQGKEKKKKSQLIQPSLRLCGSVFEAHIRYLPVCFALCVGHLYPTVSTPPPHSHPSVSHLPICPFPLPVCLIAHSCSVCSSVSFSSLPLSPDVG